MKTVFRSAMVAHVWAQQGQQSGRNANGSFYFTGTTIYSYRDSYPLARFVWAKGAPVLGVLMRAGQMCSNTTAQHMAHVSRATSRPRFYVANVMANSAEEHKANLQDYQSRIDALADKAIRARTHGDAYKRDAVMLVEEADAYARHVGSKRRVVSPEFTPEAIAAMREARAAAAERAKRQEAARVRKERAALVKRAAEWVGAQEWAKVRDWKPGDVLLRVHGDEVQTSEGAAVPVDHARRIWPVITRCKSTGQAYHRNGHTEHVGHFTVDAIDADGNMVAGCHRIGFAEINRIAPLIGLTPYAAQNVQ